VSANLYAYDFVRVTRDGMLFKGDVKRKESWFSYGEPIFSPAAGVVIETVSDLPENTFSTGGEAQSPSGADVQDPMGFGNHVKIRHSDGRVSWLLHMQPNSIPVRVGDRVHVGDLMGKIGFSGDSLFPHLHYNVTDASSYPSQGVPSYFRNFVQVLGQRRIHILSGQIDTGDLIESQVDACK
jgi:murein DD-endopeptidase MepM/ murein hydrolase activator NlpD